MADADRPVTSTLDSPVPGGLDDLELESGQTIGAQVGDILFLARRVVEVRSSEDIRHSYIAD